MWLRSVRVLTCRKPQPRSFLNACRHVYVQTKTWPLDVENDGYTDDVRKDVEQFWSPRVQEYLQNYHVKQNQLLEEDESSHAAKRYCLAMFPYPSGNLHMGHVRVYTLSNLFAQFYRMNGYNVIHPIGWDAFGLPAENAAFERGVDTKSWTVSNVKSMKEQLDKLDLMLDWDREVVTSDASYYKWTQWLFLQLFHHGLAYQANSSVNWDPIDKTVLANEQVDEEGKSWRSGAVVEKRRLKQWFFKVASFSTSLLDGLNTLKLWPKTVKELQRQWIGVNVGIRITCAVVDSTGSVIDHVQIFTGNPEDLIDAQYVEVHPKHFLTSLQGINVIHPVSQKLVPVKVSGNAENFNVESIEFGPHSKHVGTNVEDLRKFLKDHPSIDAVMCTDHLRDWLISRQRFWGTPIPIVHCESCGVVPVLTEDLPVTLPAREPDKPVLSDYESWVNTKCPKCGGVAKRETDTMDTFVDSSWYFLRYLDSENLKEAFGSNLEKYFMPVDLYVGGIEHARMHLLYARFIMHVLHDLKLVSSKEPFQNLLCQGLMLSQTYRLEGSGQYSNPEDVGTNSNDELIHVPTGLKVSTQYEKMSKSKHNGVNPDDLVKQYGSDTVKCYVLDNINPTKEILYNPRNLMGVIRWRNRLWLVCSNFINHQCNNNIDVSTKYVQSTKHISMDLLWKQRNKTIESFKNMDCFLVEDLRPDKPMRQMQAMTNMLKTFDSRAFSDHLFQRCLLDIVIMVSPFMPLVCLELWSGLIDHVDQSLNDASFGYDFQQNVLEQQWPKLLDEDNEKTLSLRLL